jgi:hypothetical protein
MRISKSVWLLSLALGAGMLLPLRSAEAVPPLEPCRDVCGDCSPHTACLNASGQESDCAEWANRRNPDVDGDGIDYFDDNCACVANANQADCDGDGTGDVCDSNSVKWELVSTQDSCDWDGDLHFDYVAVEFYSAKTYVNVCNNATCVDVYRSGGTTCNNFHSGCGFNASNCCDCSYGVGTCDHLPGCPADTCPF